MKPKPISVSDNNFQKSSAAWSIPYRVFFSFTYNIGFPFLSCQMYFLYIAGSSFATFSAIVPSITMCMHSLMSACSNAPGMSVSATDQHDIIMASNDTVGELASSLFVYCHCGLPSAHPLALITLSLFSLMNIRYLSAFCLSSVVMSSFHLGTIAFLSCNCHRSFYTCHFLFSEFLHACLNAHLRHQYMEVQLCVILVS